MRNFDVDQTAFIQGQCGYTFLFLVGVKVVIGTVVCLLLGKIKNEAGGDPSLIACVNLLRSEIRPIFVFDGNQAGLAFLEKYSTLTQTDVPVHCLHFSCDKN